MDKELKTQSISIRRLLPGRRWKILRILSRPEHFCDYMPNVKKCEVIKKYPRRCVSEWHVEADGLPIRWIQEEQFDIANFTVHFKAIKGDLQEFQGKWILKEAEGEMTEVTVEVRARLGIPIIEKVVDEALEAKLRKNFEQMLEGIEELLVTQRYRVANGKQVHDVKGFVVLGHPYNFHHLLRIFKVFKPDVTSLTPEFLMKIFEMAPSYKTSDIQNFRSETGKVVNGYFVMCPIIPDMAILNPELVLPKVLEGCRIAERLGAGILALGGFTSIVGEKYFNILKSEVKIPVTTGNTFTAAMAIEGVRKACRLMEMDMKKSRVVIIGGSGDIGSACARVLVHDAGELVLTGRTPHTLKEMQKELRKERGARVEISLDNNDAVKKADVVLAAAGTSQSIVDIDLIRPGAVVCDLAYPKNISYRSKHREDIFVFSGGLATVPTPFNLGFDAGLPSDSILYGCFAESIILALENRLENFSSGKGLIKPEAIEWVRKAGDKHGFRAAPFYWGDQLITEETVHQIHAKLNVA